MKSIQIIVLLSFMLGFSIVFSPLLVEGRHITNFTEDSQLTMLKPSFANPVIITSGDTLEIHLRSANAIELITFQLISPFMSYPLPISDSNFQNGILNYSIVTHENIIPQIYGVYLEFSLKTLYQPNAVMVIPPQEENDHDIDLIHITDIQLDGEAERTKQAQRLISEINLIRPDLVLFTGDLIEGLATVDGGPVGANEQYPIIYDILKQLKVPVLICNGNHDFSISAYGDGIELWEELFLPIDYISQLIYKNVLFVGASTYDLTGLTTTQSNEIVDIFNQNSGGLNYFFAHSDYNSQFESIYAQGSVIASFLGHEHIGSVHSVDSTLEIITDNSIPFPLHTSAPGHFRICRINETSPEYYEEIESLKLSSVLNETRLSENETIIEGVINNEHTGHIFPQITENIMLSGLWEASSFENISEIVTHYNATHTMLELQLLNVSQGLHGFKVNLYKKESITTIQESSSSQSSLSFTQTSSQLDSTPDTSAGLQYLSLAFALFFIIKKRRKERI
ncbi:MAG: metallophosphoesterase family protein [Candidatus Hodarchaeales archaeon]|jgi:hypothetical protein